MYQVCEGKKSTKNCLTLAANPAMPAVAGVGRERVEVYGILWQI